MEFDEAVKTLQETKEYKEWKTKHPKYFLAHGFLMPEENPHWQLGFSDGEHVSTFLLDTLQVIDEQEVNKQPDSVIQELNIEKFFPLEKAKEVFEKMRKEKYSQEQVYKLVIIIQHIEKDCYNITGLTHSFKTLNMKIDMNGNVISHSCEALVEQT